MGYKIKDLRNVDFNLYKYVDLCIKSNGYTVLSGFNIPYVVSGIYLVDGYPNDSNNIKLPAVAIEHDYSTDEPFQLGPGRMEKRRFFIDVFARTDGERDDLGEMIKDCLYIQMPIYDYNKVIESNTYEEIGLADFNNISMIQTNNLESKATSHKMTVKFEISYYINSGVSLIN